jgi:hypothetical protein
LFGYLVSHPFLISVIILARPNDLPQLINPGSGEWTQEPRILPSIPPGPKYVDLIVFHNSGNFTSVITACEDTNRNFTANMIKTAMPFREEIGK